MTAPTPTPTPTPENKPLWIIVIVASLLLIVAVGALSDPAPAAHPCSDEVMDAPYETGSEYYDRDQYGERAKACIDARLDSFGD